MIKIAVIIILLTSCSFGLSDTEKLEEVQALVDQYHFRHAWQEDVFDCADMSAANYRFLKDRGYGPKIAIRRDPPNGSHCYVIFPVGSGWAGLDTQRRILGERTLDSCLGKVITDLDMWKVFENPEEVAAFDQSIREGLRGPYVLDAIEPNARIPPLPLLFL